MGNCAICDKGTDDENKPMFSQRHEYEESFRTEKQVAMYNKRHFPEQEFGINLV